jgi:hypothetical protein
MPVLSYHNVLYKYVKILYAFFKLRIASTVTKIYNYYCVKDHFISNFKNGICKQKLILYPDRSTFSQTSDTTIYLDFVFRFSLIVVACFLVVLGFELRTLWLISRSSYHLSHTHSPFFNYFLVRVSWFFPRPVIFFLMLSTELGWQTHTTMPSFLRWGLTNFLPKLVSVCDPLNFYLINSWNYMYIPPCLAHIGFKYTLDHLKLLRLWIRIQNVSVLTFKMRQTSLHWSHLSFGS